MLSFPPFLSISFSLSVRFVTSQPLTCVCCRLHFWPFPWRPLHPSPVMQCSAPVSIYLSLHFLSLPVSHSYGYGLLDAGAMVSMAKTWTSMGPQRKCVLTMVAEPRLEHAHTHTHTHSLAHACTHSLSHSFSFTHTQS